LPNIDLAVKIATDLSAQLYLYCFNFVRSKSLYYESYASIRSSNIN